MPVEPVVRAPIAHCCAHHLAKALREKPSRELPFRCVQCGARFTRTDVHDVPVWSEMEVEE